MQAPVYETLTEMLKARSKESSGHPAFTFNGRAFTYEEIWQAINVFAGYLIRKGLLPGGRVVVVLPNGLDFFIAFYGILRAGGIAVPVNHMSGPERIISIGKLSEANLAVVTPDILSLFEKADHLFQNGEIALVTVEQCRSSPPSGKLPQIQPEAIAFIQYTSGSTGNPKGVQLSHDSILINMEQMIDGMGITHNDIFASWLPAYHDMGLILMTMVPFYLGLQLHLMPTNVNSIKKWIETLHERRATFTAAPDFGYRMAMLYIRDSAGFDLSALRVALNAAEPVRTNTIQKFEEAFSCKNVMMPAYGLAEATVGVSCWPPNRPIKSDNRGFVSIGKGFPSVKMKILVNGKFADTGVMGEILVKSPANTRGYYNNPNENSRLFWRKSYIRTGDMGFYDKEGDFYIVGRKKNIIIHGGQNISPQEAEEIVDVLPFVRFSAAIGIDRGHIEGEQVYVFAEIRSKTSTPANRFAGMVIEITNKFQTRIGFRPGRVYLVKPRTIPRTPNGKIKHTSLKELYLSGSLQRDGLILFPEY